MATPSVTQVGDVSHCLLRAEEWAELEDDLWEAPEDPEHKRHAGNAGAVAHAAVKGYFKTHLQFPVLVKQNGANNVTQIPCEPQLELLQGQINETGGPGWRNAPRHNGGDVPTPACILWSRLSRRGCHPECALEIHVSARAPLPANPPRSCGRKQWSVSFLKEKGERSTILNGLTFVLECAGLASGAELPWASAQFVRSQLSLVAERDKSSWNKKPRMFPKQTSFKQIQN